MRGYTSIKTVGEGSFGRAILARSEKTGELVIVKEVNVTSMGEKERRDALREVELLASLNHPNIVRFRDSEIDSTGSLCIVMEYAERGDLAAIVKSRRGRLLPEGQILDWFVQICLGLKHIHDRKILHRDLKAQNIFLTKNNMVKIGDFGIAKVLANTGQMAQTAIGTPYYLSPEICQDKKYDHKSDMWSLGCVLYELCSLRHPFEGRNIRDLVGKIMRGAYRPLPTAYSDGLRGIVAKMLRLDPRRRPGVNTLLAQPIVRARIEAFLSRSVQRSEFSHTVLHGQDGFKRVQLDRRGRVLQEAAEGAAERGAERREGGPNRAAARRRRGQADEAARQRARERLRREEERRRMHAAAVRDAAARPDKGEAGAAVALAAMVAPAGRREDPRDERMRPARGEQRQPAAGQRVGAVPGGRGSGVESAGEGSSHGAAWKAAIRRDLSRLEAMFPKRQSPGRGPSPAADVALAAKRAEIEAQETPPVAVPVSAVPPPRAARREVGDVRKRLELRDKLHAQGLAQLRAEFRRRRAERGAQPAQAHRPGKEPAGVSSRHAAEVPRLPLDRVGLGSRGPTTERGGDPHAERDMRVAGPGGGVPATGRPSGSAPRGAPTVSVPSQAPAAEPGKPSSRRSVERQQPLAGAQRARKPGREAARRGIERNESERKLPVRPALPHMLRRQQSEAALPQRHNPPVPKGKCGVSLQSEEDDLSKRLAARKKHDEERRQMRRALRAKARQHQREHERPWCGLQQRSGADEEDPEVLVVAAPVPATPRHGPRHGGTANSGGGSGDGGEDSDSGGDGDAAAAGRGHGPARGAGGALPVEHSSDLHDAGGGDVCRRAHALLSPDLDQRRQRRERARVELRSKLEDAKGQSRRSSDVGAARGSMAVEVQVCEPSPAGTAASRRGCAAQAVGGDCGPWKRGFDERESAAADGEPYAAPAVERARVWAGAPGGVGTGPAGDEDDAAIVPDAAYEAMLSDLQRLVGGGGAEVGGGQEAAEDGTEDVCDDEAGVELEDVQSEDSRSVEAGGDDRGGTWNTSAAVTVCGLPVRVRGARDVLVEAMGELPDSAAHRIEALRVHLEERVGLDLLMEGYMAMVDGPGADGAGMDAMGEEITRLFLGDAEAAELLKLLVEAERKGDRAPL